MVRKPTPQSAAKLLHAYLKEIGVTLKHQQALEVIARIKGFANWSTRCAAGLWWIRTLGWLSTSRPLMRCR